MPNRVKKYFLTVMVNDVITNIDEISPEHAGHLFELSDDEHCLSGWLTVKCYRNFEIGCFKGVNAPSIGDTWGDQTGEEEE